ncbi:lysophospholipid acyltransferase family protein [Magnetococcus sp. PR-3]|uniref:lysophospholipid acyltransferase family protein n=1 Tax=Magnetococcus sp. PR-3 TaxID=3120355 RepID=UPI002FCE5334
MAMQALRSIFFYIISQPVTVGLSLTVLVLALVPGTLALRRGAIRWWGTFVGRDLLGWCCGMDEQVQGLQSRPTDQPCVIMAKHQSSWETIRFFGLFPNAIFVLKKELLRVPIYGWALATSQQIAIDRGHPRHAITTLLKDGQSALKQGHSVLVFPEGTRVPIGEMGRFNPGGIRLALTMGVPILPVVHNAGCVWPKGTFIKTPGTVRVRVGTPINTQGRSRSEWKAVMQELEEAMQELMDELE